MIDNILKKLEIVRYLLDANPCVESQFSLPHTKSPLQLLSAWHPPSPIEHGTASVQHSADGESLFTKPQQALDSSQEWDSKHLKTKLLVLF